MILISACLCGVPCRYDGKCAEDADALALLRAGEAVPLCPEQLGGLPTPRDPAEIVRISGNAAGAAGITRAAGIAGAADGVAVLRGEARVVTAAGEDVTDAFLRGAHETLRLARLLQADRAILKTMSPSCGCGRIYDGSFTGKEAVGDGVCAALLRRHGIALEAR